MALLIGLAASAPAFAQTPAEHAAHHPDTAASGPRRALPLPVAAGVDTAQLLRDGRARMAEGTALLADGVNRLSTAATLERHGDMLAALEQMRAALGLIESGVSVRMALDTSARALAPPQFLRDELSPAHRSADRLSAGHIAFMAVAVLTAIAMLALQVLRVRRIGALRSRPPAP